MKRALSSAITVGCLFAGRALGDDGHYQNFLVGECAAGMGGAYTAIADDPSGTYYNPAGLVNSRSGIVSANLNFYGFQQQSLSNALHVPGGSLINNVTGSVSAAVSQLSTVPGTAGEVHGIGELDAKGQYRHAWALSVQVPDSTSGNSINYVIDKSGNLQSLSQTTLDQTALVGLGYALRWNDQWSFGLSGNGLYRQITRNNRSVSALGYGTEGPSQAFFEDDISLKLAVLSLYLQAGALYHVDQRLTLGLTVATPSLTVFSNASTDEILVGGGGPQNGLTEIYQPNLKGDSRWPIHGRLGAAYQVIPRLLLAADFSLWGVLHYGLVNNASASQNLPNYVNVIDRNVTFNVDLGAQYVLFGKYPVRGGFFTNLSSAPAIDTSPAPQLDNVNLYGFTLGFTLPGEHTESTFGLNFSFGNGQSKTPTVNQATQALTYASGPTYQLFLDLYAGGSYRF